MQHKEASVRPDAVVKFDVSAELWLAKNIEEEHKTDPEGNEIIVWAFDEAFCHTQEPGELARDHFDTFWDFAESGGGDSILTYLRDRRKEECFTVCDRPLWLETLTEEQLNELKAWRLEWLNVTSTLEIPVKPEWI